jgi:hypothetical protein
VSNDLYQLFSTMPRKPRHAWVYQKFRVSLKPIIRAKSLILHDFALVGPVRTHFRLRFTNFQAQIPLYTCAKVQKNPVLQKPSRLSIEATRIYGKPAGTSETLQAERKLNEKTDRPGTSETLPVVGRTCEILVLQKVSRLSFRRSRFVTADRYFKKLAG